MAPCPNCASENPPGARFCNACGAPLEDATGSSREERRIVTALFADMAGFTARSERLDPEDVRAILNRYYARLRVEIEGFGGVVEKFIGDAVVAFFGAPVAHGDDPERAIRSAFAIRAAVEEMNASDPELRLEVRLAVNTGEAIVSLSAAELYEGMVAGDVINTASRLQMAAPANGILVGEETYRATRGLFEYETVEPLTVKGKREPVRAWIALRPRAAPGERQLSTAPMLGRAHEMDALERIFDGVLGDRRPHLVTVFGDAGIGKTRLASEFAECLEGRGARILRGRSLPYGESTLYGPFAQQVKQFANIFASDEIGVAEAKLNQALTACMGLETAAEIAPHLELLMGLNTGGEATDRQILFRAARRFVETLAAKEPTLLVFEDVHWADSGTLDLLEVLASRIRGVPLMMLALARPNLLVARPAWGGGLPAYTAVSLEPLDHACAIELAAVLLERGARDSHELRLIDTAEGNPLFIEELVAAAIERPSGTGDALPTTIRELISARLDALPAEQRDVLFDAAVVGKVFWRGALEQMRGDARELDANDVPLVADTSTQGTSFTGIALEDALDSLEARDLIRHEPRSWIERDDQFAFKHALIREVAYATLPRARRRLLHGVVARFLEAATAGAGATATALARHWIEAGDKERAREYLVIAGDQAARGWAKDEAAALYGEALELGGDPERQRGILRKQAVALAAAVHLHLGDAVRTESHPE